MTSLTAIFGDSREGSADSEKLLELYWNRAELKKEFANLREETFRLNARVKEEQGTTARLNQRLEHLENLLLDPEWVHNVVAFYQLRALNGHLQRKLERFAEQLKQQRERREQQRRLSDWRSRQERRAGELRREIQRVDECVSDAEKRLQVERHALAEMGAIRRLFRKRSVTRKLDELATELEESRSEAVRLQAALGEIESGAAPDAAGLDINAKRTINFMILAFAQQMYLHFETDQLAALAKEAGDKGVGSVNYGTLSDVLTILDSIKRHRASMQKSGANADILQARARMIAATARFRGDDEAVPERTTTGTLYDIDGNGHTTESQMNLLAENYWGVQRVLSR